MKMKFFQGIADIKRHYDDMITHFDNTKYGHMLLGTWNVKVEDKKEIEEEREALRYLLGCQLMLVHDENATKPSISVMNRCFHRHLGFLSDIHRCTSETYKKSNPLVRKEFETCQHYLVQFSVPSWYNKLPNEILTFENKYKESDL